MGEYGKRDREKAGAQRWKITAVICGFVAVAAAVVTVVLLTGFFGEERESEMKIEQLRVKLESEEPSASPEPEQTEASNEPGTEQAEQPARLPENPYAAAFRENGDMAAWIVVEGTVIDYPVMQTMEDENYYLNRDFYGNEDKAGCLILDTDSPVYDVEGSGNLIIHGHNMKTGTMFGELDAYKDEDYYQEHKHMQLYTRSEKREYEVLAVFYSQVYYSTDQVFKYYNFFKTEDETEFHDFYDNIKKMSLYDTGVEAQLGDQFLTLSTCAYHVEDGRFVVVAKETGREEKYEMP